MTSKRSPESPIVFKGVINYGVFRKRKPNSIYQRQDILNSNNKYQNYLHLRVRSRWHVVPYERGRWVRNFASHQLRSLANSLRKFNWIRGVVRLVFLISKTARVFFFFLFLSFLFIFLLSSSNPSNGRYTGSGGCAQLASHLAAFVCFDALLQSDVTFTPIRQQICWLGYISYIGTRVRHVMYDDRHTVLNRDSNTSGRIHWRLQRGAWGRERICRCRWVPAVTSCLCSHHDSQRRNNVKNLRSQNRLVKLN